MTIESPPERILTRVEIEAARDEAVICIRDDAKRKHEALGTVPVTDDSHDNEDTIVAKVVWLVDGILINKEAKKVFSYADIFDLLRHHIAPTFRDKKTGEIRPRAEENIREWNAAAGHLLDALDLKQQFMGYNRLLKSKTIEGEGRE